MMNNKFSKIGVIITGLMFLTALTSAQSYVWEESFEDYSTGTEAPGNWTDNSGSYDERYNVRTSGDVTGIPAVDGSNFYGTGDATPILENPYRYNDFGGDSFGDYPYRINFSFYEDQEFSSGGGVYFYNSNDKPLFGVFSNNPEHHAIDGNSYVNYGTGTYEEWQNISLEVVSTNQYTVYENGTEQGTYDFNNTGSIDKVAVCHKSSTNSKACNTLSTSDGDSYWRFGVDDFTIESQIAEFTNVTFYDFKPVDGSTEYVNGDQTFEVTVEANSTDYNDIDIEGIFDGVINQTFNHPADGTNQTYSFTIKDFNKSGTFNYRFSAISDSPNGDFIKSTQSRDLNVISDNIEFTLNNPNDNEKFYKPLTQDKTLNYNVDVSTGNNESWFYSLNVTLPNGNTVVPVSGSQPSSFSFNIDTDQTYSQTGQYSWLVYGEGQDSGETVTSATRTFNINNESATINFISPKEILSFGDLLNDPIDNSNTLDNYTGGDDSSTADEPNYISNPSQGYSDPSIGMESNAVLFNIKYEDSQNTWTKELYLTDQNKNFVEWRSSVHVFNLDSGCYNYPDDDLKTGLKVIHDDWSYQSLKEQRIDASGDQNVNADSNITFNRLNSTHINISSEFNNNRIEEYSQGDRLRLKWRFDSEGSEGGICDNYYYYLTDWNSTLSSNISTSSGTYFEEIPYEVEVTANFENSDSGFVEFYHDGNLIHDKGFFGDGATSIIKHNESFNDSQYNKDAQVKVLGSDGALVESSEVRLVSVLQEPEFYIQKPENNSTIEVDNLNDKTGNYKTTFEGIINVGEAGKGVLQLEYPNGTVVNLTSSTYTRSDAGDNKTLLKVKEIKNITLEEVIGKSIIESENYTFSIKYFGDDSLQNFESNLSIYKYVDQDLNAAEKILDMIIVFFKGVDEYLQNNLGDAGKIFVAIIGSTALASLAYILVEIEQVAVTVFGSSIVGFTIAEYVPKSITFIMVVLLAVLLAGNVRSRISGG